MISFSCVMFFILYFDHNGQSHYWSKSLNVLISNGYNTYLLSSHRHSERKGDIGSCRAYEKGRQTSSQGLASHHLLIVKK